ncbi:MAG: TRAP transporter small permease [Clostridiales bacterium]|nr:TRAP transporter small permease [Clostridiales bacterium]
MRQKIENFFLWKWLLSMERFVMIFCSIAVIVTIGYVVISRYFLNVNFTASDELLTILALWLYFVGGVYGSYEDSHIKADVLTMIVKGDVGRRIADVAVKAISLAVSVLLALWAIQYLQLAMMLGGKTLILKLPMMTSRLALVVGYTLPVIYNVYHLFISIDNLRHGKISTAAHRENEMQNIAAGGMEE